MLGDVRRDRREQQHLRAHRVYQHASLRTGDGRFTITIMWTTKKASTNDKLAREIEKLIRHARGAAGVALARRVVLEQRHAQHVAIHETLRVARRQFERRATKYALMTDQ